MGRLRGWWALAPYLSLISAGLAIAGDGPQSQIADEAVIYHADFAVCELLAPDVQIDQSVRGTYTVNDGEPQAMPFFPLLFLKRDDAKNTGMPGWDRENAPNGFLGDISVVDGKVMFEENEISEFAKNYIAFTCRLMA
jgi:hypothetical protein